MDYDNIAEEFANELSYCNYMRRRRSVSESEPQNLLPPELFRQTSERSPAKSRISQCLSPSRAAAASNNGCSSPGDASMHEDYESRPNVGSRKIGEWLSSSQRRRRYAAEDHDVEMGEPLTGATEFRRRAGSHGIRDLLRIRPRCNSHSEKHGETGSTPARGGSASGGNGTPVSPGTPSSSASSGTSSSVNRFKVFLDTFRHRANSDSFSSPRTQLHGWSPVTTTATATTTTTTKTINAANIYFDIYN